MYALQISQELVAMDKIVAASSPGGQWLPVRGRGGEKIKYLPPCHTAHHFQRTNANQIVLAETRPPFNGRSEELKLQMRATSSYVS